MTASLDLGELGLDRGGHLLLRHALAALPPGSALAVHGSAPELEVHLRAFARSEGHTFELAPRGSGTRVSLQARIVRGSAVDARWAAAERAGAAGPEGVVD